MAAKAETACKTAHSAVLVAAKRLSTAVEIEDRMSTLEALAKGLEHELHKFELAHESFSEHCEDASDHDATRTALIAKYVQSRKLFLNYVTKCTNEKVSQDFALLLDRLAKYCDTCDIMLNKTDPSMSNDECDTMVDAAGHLDVLLADLLQKKCQLDETDCRDPGLESKVHDTVLRVDQVKLKVNVASRQNQAKLLNISSLSPFSLRQTPNSVASDIPVVIASTSGDTAATSVAADLVDTTVASNGGSQTDATSEHTGNVESSEGNVEQINLPAGTQPVAEQTHLSPQASSVVSGVTPQGYSVYPPLHPALGAPGASTSQLAAPISSGAAPQGVYHPSHMAFSATGATTSHTASHISSGVMPHGYPVYQNVYPAPGAAGTSTPLQASQASTGYPAYPSIHTALGATGVTYTALGATGVMSTAGGNPAQQVVHAGLGAQGNQQWYPYGSGNHVQSPRDSVTSTSSGIQTKRPFLPTFSGERADWPEFKFAWRALAEQQYGNKILLALELKKACSKGRATNSIRHLAVTSDRVYDELWSRLSEEYDDQGLSVQAALNRLFRVNAVTEKDYKGIVEYIDVVEGVHNELRELSQLEAISMVDVDRLSHLLPHAMNIDWMRKFRDLPEAEKIRPFAAFVRFLRSERAYLARLAESTVQHRRSVGQQDVNRSSFKHTSGTHTAMSSSPMGDSCAVHRVKDHLTTDCPAFKEMTMKEREETVWRERRCWKCFGPHFIYDCKDPRTPCQCGRNHHPLVCHDNTGYKQKSESHGAECAEEEPDETLSVYSGLTSVGAMALFPIHRVNVVGYRRPIAVFTDGGSNASYVTESCADRLKLKRISKVTLDVKTVGGTRKKYHTAMYEIPLRVSYTQVKKIQAYGLKEITGPLSPLDEQVLQELFPDSDPSTLVRPSSTVDVLIGTDYFGLHPKSEVARAGEHLSIMKGDLGACLVGTHPKLKEATMLDSDLPKEVSSLLCQAVTNTVQVNPPAFMRPQALSLDEEVPRCEKRIHEGVLSLDEEVPRCEKRIHEDSKEVLTSAALEMNANFKSLGGGDCCGTQRQQQQDRPDDSQAGRQPGGRDDSTSQKRKSPELDPGPRPGQDIQKSWERDQGTDTPKPREQPKYTAKPLKQKTEKRWATRKRQGSRWGKEDCKPWREDGRSQSQRWQRQDELKSHNSESWRTPWQHDSQHRGYSRQQSEYDTSSYGDSQRQWRRPHWAQRATRRRQV